MGSSHMHKTLRVQDPYDDHVLIGQSAQWHTPHFWSFPYCAACGMLDGTPSALIWQHVATGFNVGLRSSQFVPQPMTSLSVTLCDVRVQLYSIAHSPFSEGKTISMLLLRG
jgi:hypothetical protein